MAPLFELVHNVYAAIRNTREFLRETRWTLSLEDNEETRDLRRTHRRMVFLAAAVTVVGCLIIPCSAPWLTVWVRGIAPGDALFRMILGLVLSVVFLLLYLKAGAAVACLTVSPAFLQTSVGAKWMRLFPRKRRLKTHRVVCLLWAFIGFGVMIGKGFLLAYMAPTPWDKL